MAEDELSMDNDSDVLYELRIPEERVAVLIGKDGDTKELVEAQSGCKLNIAKEGLVAITCNDGLKLYAAREIVKAIGRGFNPKIALLLLKTDYALDLIDLNIVTRSKSDMERIKGRIIGKGGKSREELERLTETYISVYGKTIGIIGEQDQVTIARQGLAKLIGGAMHSTVYRFLEKKRREMLLRQ